jgi:hypothetical protein
MSLRNDIAGIALHHSIKQVMMVVMLCVVPHHGLCVVVGSSMTRLPVQGEEREYKRWEPSCLWQYTIEATWPRQIDVVSFE